MKSEKKELDKIFERSLKWRLLKKSFTSVEGVRVLINNFRNYDLTNTGKINRDNWVTCLYSDGLTIGISKEDLSKLFDKYKDENSETCDYKKFAFDIFFKHKNNISLNKANPNGNIMMNLNDPNDKSKFFSFVLLESASNSVGTPSTQVGLVCLNNVSNFLALNLGTNIVEHPKAKGVCISTLSPNP